jgi:hypothetical protein
MATTAKVFVLLVTMSSASELYLNEWSVHIPAGQTAADKFARDNGLVNLGEILPGSNEFHMKHPRRSKRSTDQDHHVQKRILVGGRIRVTLRSILNLAPRGKL